MKNSILKQKQKNIYEQRKKELKNNLQKRKKFKTKIQNKHDGCIRQMD